MFFCFFVLFFFLKICLLSAGRMRFSKAKKTKKGPIFNFKKCKNWTIFNFTILRGLRPNLLILNEGAIISGCGFFAYNWKIPAYNGAFLLRVDKFRFFTYNWSFLTYNFSFLLTVGFFAYNG